MTSPPDNGPGDRWVLHAVLATTAVLLVGAAAVGFTLLRPRDSSAVAPPAPTATAAPAGDTHAGWPALPALAADTAPTGAGSGEKTQIAFENHTGERYLISWLDEDGSLTAYATLEPGHTYDQTTYAGHYWQVATADGTPVAVFRAADEPGRAIIR